VWGAVTEDTIADSAQQQFAKTQSSHPEFAGLNLKTLFGDPGMVLTDYAQEINAELIVVSSHGRTGLTRLLLGSVAERIVRHAHCPVLVLR
jgi:nucleotide-binding universal stress UspA family protein